MSITSIFPFVVMTTLFVITAYLLSLLPPYSGVIDAVMAKKSFNRELEGLRGLLAFCVVVHHAVIWYLMIYYGSAQIPGASGNLYEQLGVGSVTLFFFITGFLFWSKLIAKPTQPFRPFILSRLRRLGPGYLGAIGFLLVLVACLTHFHLQTTVATLARNLLQIFWAETPLLNGLPYTPWLWGVTWTLRYECLFYLVIPFLGWFAGTFRKSILFVATCGLLYLLSCWATRVHHPLPALYGGFLRHLFFTFSFGIVTAHLVRIPKVRAFGSSTWAAAIALLLLIANFYLLPANYGLPESLSLAFPFLAVACGCTFWGALQSRPVLFMGQISYSVYLIHPLILGSILLPIYRMEGSTMQNPRVYWTLLFCMAPLIVCIATLWHWMFELPFLSRRDAGVAPALGRPGLASGTLPQPQVHGFALRNGQRAAWLPKKSSGKESDRSSIGT